MLRHLTRLFSRPQATPTAARPRVAVDMAWFADTRLPIVD